jgi:pimeloyl-ACP methyl ester carboxylesterase
VTVTPTTHWSRSTVIVEETAVSVMRGGAGPQLLFLHGSEAFSSWLPFMDELARRFEVIVPDHPGFGRSATPPWLDTIGDLAHFYRSFIATLELHDIVLAGHGIGGWIAGELALRNTAGIRSLVLIDSAGLPLTVDGVDTFMCSPSELRSTSYNDELLAPALDDAALAQQPKDSLMTARLAWQPPFYDPQLAKWLHRLQLPTLIVWGADDRIFPAAQAATFAATIDGARTVIIPNAGHLPHLEAPLAFADAVTRFATGESS